MGELEYLLRRNPKFSLAAAARRLPTYMKMETRDEIVGVLRGAGLPES